MIDMLVQERTEDEEKGNTWENTSQGGSLKPDRVGNPRSGSRLPSFDALTETPSKSEAEFVSLKSRHFGPGYVSHNHLVQILKK